MSRHEIVFITPIPELKRKEGNQCTITMIFIVGHTPETAVEHTEIYHMGLRWEYQQFIDACMMSITRLGGQDVIDRILFDTCLLDSSVYN